MFTDRRTARRLAAIEGVLLETRLTMGSTFQALAVVLADVPDIADRLRTAGELAAQVRFSEPDPTARLHVIAANEHMVAILDSMAQTIEASRAKAGQIVINAGGGLQ